MILTIAKINQNRYIKIKIILLITVIAFWSLLSWESYPFWPSIRPRPDNYIIIIITIIIIVFWSLPSWEGGLQYVPDQTCFFKVQLGQSAPGGRTRAIGFSKKKSPSHLSKCCFLLFSLFFQTLFLAEERLNYVGAKLWVGGSQYKEAFFPRKKSSYTLSCTLSACVLMRLFHKHVLGKVLIFQVQIFTILLHFAELGNCIPQTWNFWRPFVGNIFPFCTPHCKNILYVESFVTTKSFHKTFTNFLNVLLF